MPSLKLFIILIALRFNTINASFECVNPMPLGSESGVLPNTAFTATSQATSREAYKARLHGQFGN
jgi:hypothetical protein